MRINKAFTYLICFILAVFLCACSADNSQAGHKISIIIKSTDSEFWQSFSKGVRSAATEYNVEVSLCGPENEEDYYTQNMLIESAAENGAEVIVLSAISSENSNEVIRNAANKGVRIITVDSGVAASVADLFIGTDNYKAGASAGIAAAQGFSDSEKIRIGIVNCYEQTDNGIRREEGFRDYIATLDNAEIVGSVNTTSNADSAAAAAVSLLSFHPEINVLVGFNEWMALGVGNAIRQLEVKDCVKGVGFDANTVCVGMIETGEMDALIVQNPFAMGYLSVQYAYQIISKESIKDKELYTDVTTVTRENVFDDDVQKILFTFE